MFCMVVRGSLSVGMEKAAPCRNAGAPPEDVLELTVAAIRAIADDEVFLGQHGLSKSEFELALPAAIQKVRGSAAASNSDRRQFMRQIFDALKAADLISDYHIPAYGDDTVYRLDVPSIGQVAIIQKGCPDGNHSSVRWSRPDWAVEAYLWWLCDSLSYNPGDHVAKGVNRLRNRFFDDAHPDAIDGVIFHNAMCGSSMRPCPKAARAARIGEFDVPPPCVWVMPERNNMDNSASSEWNWDGGRIVSFPRVLLSLFGISDQETASFLGNVGFAKGARGTRMSIASRYGAGQSTIFRSDPR